MAAPHVAGAVALLYEKASVLGVNLAPVDAKLAVMNGDRVSVAPLDSRTSRGFYPIGYSFDGEREGILNIPSALSFLDNPATKTMAQPNQGSLLLILRSRPAAVRRTPSN